MKLVVGLGNPGKNYAGTRHNAGFVALNVLAKAFNFDEFKKADKYKAHTAEGQIGSEKVVLVKPQTYMNLSGQTVQSLASYYKLTPSDIVVIYDEVAIPCGEVRIRTEGSAGGHNGMKSIISVLGSNFTRVRIGIKSEKPFPGALEDFVLGKFTNDEKDQLMEVMSDLPGLIEKVLSNNIEAAMNDYN